jgi:hypothetical protein
LFKLSISIIISIWLCVSLSHAAEFSQSDILFEKASKAVKERNYSEAIDIFEKLAIDYEADAQYNLALLLKSGRGRPQDYSNSLKWGWLALLGSIEEASKLVDEIKDMMPEPNLRIIRKEVKNYIQNRADGGNLTAISQMGDYFLAVPEKPNYKNAYLWFVIAAAFQVEGSRQKRDKVEKEIEGRDILKIQGNALEIFKKISETKN